MAGGGDRDGVSGARATLALLVALVACLAIPAAAGAATASWAFEPTSFDFGTVEPRETAAEPAQLKLVNTGEVSLFPTVVSLTPADDFGLASNGCRFWLAPGGSCTIEVTFRPRTSGPKEAILKVAAWEEDAPPVATHLSGTGPAPTVTIDPPAIDFGVIPASNGDREQRSATITNRGPGDLSISNLEFFTGGALVTHFGPLNWMWSENACRYGLTLPPGDSCTAAFALGSSKTVSPEGELRITDNALDSPQVIKVSDTVWATPPVIPGPPHPEDTRRFECRLDDDFFRSCASPAHYRALQPGKHQFRVRPVGVHNFTVLGPAVSYAWRVVGVRRR